MKLTINQSLNQGETEVIINCNVIDARLQHLIDYIRQHSFSLEGRIGDRVYSIALEDIYYMDCVDGKTFLYSQEQVYESKERLNTLEEKLGRTSFTRISKNCILNCMYLKSVSPLWNHRMEATLTSGEKLVITRNYIGSLKEKLEMGRFKHA
ncbi:MAG: LytTR family transcriptional regulator DNA-binding domain-containing protein [Niameybacter sp.]|nr:LytTR family transcriptional regulator DNA-binding domain-containing protein [Niameybacter sp.]